MSPSQVELFAICFNINYISTVYRFSYQMISQLLDMIFFILRIFLHRVWRSVFIGIQIITINYIF